MRRAILLDRDGTVCEEVGYLNHVDRVRLIDGSAEAIRLAKTELNAIEADIRNAGTRAASR